MAQFNSIRQPIIVILTLFLIVTNYVIVLPDRSKIVMGDFGQSLAVAVIQASRRRLHTVHPGTSRAIGGLAPFLYSVFYRIDYAGIGPEAASRGSSTAWDKGSTPTSVPGRSGWGLATLMRVRTTHGSLPSFMSYRTRRTC